MTITQAQLDRIMPNAVNRTDLFIDHVNTTLDRFEINTPLRIAAFLAQIAHESGELRYVKEIASGADYDNRKDLGNTCADAVRIARDNKTTAGRFYKGRGLIQVTGYYNFKDCSEFFKQDFIHHPELLSEPLYATLSAGWFWNSRNLNGMADKSQFKDITKKINGGYNGMASRLTYYGRAKAVLKI